MRFKLEENTQEAFQFLLLGAAIVLGIRALVGGIGLWLESGSSDELVTAIAAYRNNYLLRDGRTIVIGGAEIFGRLSFAFLMALIAGVLGSSIGAGWGRLSARPTLPFAVQGARTGMLFIFALFLYAALFLPPRAVRISDEGALVIERPALLGILSLPIPAKETLIPWETVEQISQRSRAGGMQGCGINEEVTLHVMGSIHVIAMENPAGSDCDRAIARARHAADQLIQALRMKYMRPTKALDLSFHSDDDHLH